MSARSYAGVHLVRTASGTFTGGFETREAELGRLHAAELSQRESRERSGEPMRFAAGLRNLTRFLTRSPGSLTTAAAAGGTRRIS